MRARVLLVLVRVRRAGWGSYVWVCRVRVLGFGVRGEGQVRVMARFPPRFS